MESCRTKKNHTHSRFVCFALIMIILIGAVSFAVAENGRGSTDMTPARRIYVVYDTSASMFAVPDTTRWCSAYYALETFISMMGEKDTMVVYPMSTFYRNDLTEKTKTVQGSDLNRVAEIHKWKLPPGIPGSTQLLNGGTSYDAVEKAKEDILADKSDAEKWFVMITDGDVFSQLVRRERLPGLTTATTDVGEVMTVIYDQLESNGINTIYLAIGSAAQQHPIGGARNSQRVFYVKNASEVLEKVIDATNIIFTKRELKTTRVTNNQCKYDIDIPVTKYMVFVQGEGNELKEISIDGTKLQPDQVIPIQYRDDPKADLGITTGTVDKALQGVMYIFNSDSPDTPFRAGEYTINTTGGSDNVRVFYNIGAQINCEMLKDGKKVNPSDSLFSGDYTVTGIQFVDPTNGMAQIQSDLLDVQKYEIKILTEKDGEFVVHEGEHFNLRPGVAMLQVTATFSDIELTSTKTYQVHPYSAGYLDVADGQYVIDQVDLKNGMSVSLPAQLFDQETSAPMSEEIWSNMRVEIPEADGLTWTVTRGATWPQYELNVKAANGYQNVKTGHYDVVYEIIPYEDEEYKIELTFPITVNAYDPFAIQKVDGTTTISQVELQKKKITVQVYVTDGQGNPLTDEVWNELELACSEADHNIRWTTDKPQTGLFTLTGELAGNKVLSVTPGTHQLAYTAKYADQEGMTAEIGGTYDFEVTAVDFNGVTLIDNAITVNQSELRGDGKSITVRAADKNNEPLTEELWEAIQFTFPGAHGLVLSCEKGDHVSEYTVRIKAGDQGCGSVPTNTLLDMTYVATVDGTDCEPKPFSLTVEPWKPIRIADIQPVTWNQDEFGNGAKKTVPLTVVREDGQKITDAEWATVRFDKLMAAHGLCYEVIKGSVPGEAVIEVKSIDNKVLTIVPDKHTLDVGVHYEIAEENFDYQTGSPLTMTIETSKDTGGGDLDLGDLSIIRQEDLADGQDVLVMIVDLTITDFVTGESHIATAEEANLTTVIADDAAGLHFDIVQTAPDEPTFFIFAHAITSSGTVDCSGPIDLHWTTHRIQNGEDCGLTGIISGIQVVPYKPVRFADPDALSFSIQQEDIKLKRKNQIKIAVKMQDGSDVPDEIASRLQLVADVDDPKGLKWNISADATDPGCFICTLTSIDGTMKSVETGVYTVPVKVKYIDPDEDIDNISDQTNLTMNINACPVQPIALEILDLQDSYRGTRYKWDENLPFRVKATYQNEPLPQDMWNMIVDSCLWIETPRKNLDFDIRKSAVPGEWIVSLVPKNNKGYNTASGNVPLNVQFDMEIDEIPYRGATSQMIRIQEDTLYRILEWLDDYKYPIIAALSALYLLCGYYLFKRRLVTRRYQIIFSMPNERSCVPVKWKIRRRMCSVLVPWPFCKAQKAEITCYNSSFYCTFPNFTAVAVGKRNNTTTFRMTEIGKFNPDNTKINAMRVPKDIEEQEYELAGFQIRTTQGLRHVGLVTIEQKMDEMD